MDIDSDRAEKALNYLALTDMEIARLKAAVAESEYVVDLRERTHFLTASGNVEERKAFAKVQADVAQAHKAYFESIAAYEGVKARRERAVITLDLFRTLEASRRKGG